MLVLRSSPASPFGRKIRLVAAALALESLLQIEVTGTREPDEQFLRQNPLGKIPVLITEDGLALYDSRVIVDYLDHRAGGGRLIPADAGRYEVLRLQALADGICDAAVLMTYEERYRPQEKRHAPWTDRLREKIVRALDVVEASPPLIPPSLDIGVISLACALGYLDLRQEGFWRETHPRLIAWLDDFASQLPSFETTK